MTPNACARFAVSGDKELGPLKLLPGVWSNTPNLPGRGWNLIALPFETEPGEGFNYRLLMNQYDEELKFSTVDKGVPNRGIRVDRTVGGRRPACRGRWTTSSPSRRSPRTIFQGPISRAARASPSITSPACGCTCGTMRPTARISRDWARFPTETPSWRWGETPNIRARRTSRSP